MNTNLKPHVGSIAAIAAFTLGAIVGPVFAQQPEPPVAVKTDGMPSHLRERILEKAAQGQTALIQYINRTKTVHQLRVEDVVKPPREATLAAKPDETGKRVAEAPATDAK